MFLPIELAAIPITPTLDTSGAYASGDLLFDSTKVKNAVLNGKGFSYLRSVLTKDSANQKVAIDLLFFVSDPGTLGTLNAALQISAAQLALLCGMISIATADYTTLQGSGNALGQTLKADLPLPTIATSKDLWVAGVARGSATFGAHDLTLVLNLERH